eukprot:CAMPEP_0184398576 /NCGR_PEP_ID=MMETSP0007-20130409/66265_1 /TAXON_ID=97485 /ORGANISM="Prymnesium parvum, Strain Texoma1" /LENGTH=43 /DNA_ID= /DNA_START= /DNA_END= /DNA_ORIENTATION=
MATCEFDSRRPAGGVLSEYPCLNSGVPSTCTQYGGVARRRSHR